MNIVHCSYQVDFSEGPPIQCVKYHVNSAICENLGLDHVLMPSIWSSPDQHHADNLLDVIGNLVNIRHSVHLFQSIHEIIGIPWSIQFFKQFNVKIETFCRNKRKSLDFGQQQRKPYHVPSSQIIHIHYPVP